MPENFPSHDPMEDRLRATFDAERQDLDRRRPTHPVLPAKSATKTWIPLTVAAALLAIAGFVFVGNQTDTASVDLDIAAQTANDTDDTAGQVQGSPDDCIANFDPSTTVILGYDQTLAEQGFDNAIRALSEPVNDVAPDGPHAVEKTTRALLLGDQVSLTGACRTVVLPGTGAPSVVWYQILGAAGTPNEWVNSSQLVTPDIFAQFIAGPQVGAVPPGPTPDQVPPFTPGPTPDSSPGSPPPTTQVPTDPINGCGEALLFFPLRFVSGIDADDPDGGLVAHSSPGIDAPVTRILLLDEVVSLTGQCEFSDTGSRWYELSNGDDNTDWVSGRYLADVVPACLTGEQYGARARTGQLMIDLTPGDSLNEFAVEYGIALEELLAANPWIERSQPVQPHALWIPGVVEQGEQIFGPLDGLAVLDGDKTAFAPNGSKHFRWYPSDAIDVARPCFGQGQPGPVCLQGYIQLVDMSSPEPIWTGVGPVQADATGRTLPGITANTADSWVEVQLRQSDGQQFTGLVDPTRTDVVVGACTPGSGAPDSHLVVPCTATDSTVVVGSTTRGSAASNADHLHDMSATTFPSADGPCTRIVFEFGATGDGVDQPAGSLPPLGIDKFPRSVRITLPDTMFAGISETTRVDFESGIALSVVDGSTSSLEVLLDQAGPVNVWFAENPARVIVDALGPGASTIGAFGQDFVLRTPIQTEPYGRGVAQGQPITVSGFGRPFESLGQYRIYAVSPDIDPAAYLAANPDPIIEGPMPTSSWVDGWGTFAVTIPSLEPGSYIALFGEAPPGGDDIAFIGTGQLFRVFDPNAPRPSEAEPVAQLLPNVEITFG